MLERSSVTAQDRLELEAQRASVLERAPAVDHPRHSHFGIDPFETPRQLKRNEQPLSGQHRIGRTDAKSAGGQIDDAIGDELKVALSDNLTREARQMSNSAAANPRVQSALARGLHVSRSES